MKYVFLLLGTLQLFAAPTITIQNNTLPLVIDTAIAGSQPDPVADGTSVFSYGIDATTGTIAGFIDEDMPENTTFEVNLHDTGTGGTSAGVQSMSNTSVNLITGITTLSLTDLLIDFDFTATVDALPQSFTRTLTFTIIDGV